MHKNYATMVTGTVSDGVAAKGCYYIATPTRVPFCLMSTVYVCTMLDFHLNASICEGARTQLLKL